METVDKVENNLIPDQAVTGVADLIIDEVIAVNKENKQVELKSGQQISYQKLVLGTGSKPFKPPIDGVNLEGVFGVRKNVDLLNKIKDRVDEKQELVIIGGGFIGIEFADECRKNRDINVSIVTSSSNNCGQIG